MPLSSQEAGHVIAAHVMGAIDYKVLSFPFQLYESESTAPQFDRSSTEDPKER